MSEMVLCKRNIHYYDPEKHGDCPYCKRIEEGRGGDPTAPADESDWKPETSAKGRDAAAGGGKKPHIDRSATAPWYSGDKDKAEVFEPVVGWLVAVEGPSRGRDFRLKPGRNVVGRTVESEVYVEDDDLMSRDHAIVYYYGEINNFYVEDNKSKHGTFILPAMDLVVERRPIKDGDRIKTGKSVFILKTLCNEAFKWENLKES